MTLATPEQIARGEVVENSYIVAFRAPSGSASLRFPSYLGESRYHYGYLAETFLTEPRVKDVRYITSVDLANPQSPAATPDFEPPPALMLAWDENRLDDISAALARVDFTDTTASAELLKQWEQSGALWYAEPNYINTLQQNPFTPKLAEDYKAANVHWHNSIKLGAALENLSKATIESAQAPVIAVLDSGVDVNHPALQGRIWENPSPGVSGCGDDKYGCDTTLAKKELLGSGNVNPYRTGGYGEDCPFADAPDKSAERDERGVCGHGTHVSGIIAAKLDAAGVGGVCPVCRIMVIKIITAIGGRGVASDDAILGGFKYLTLFGTSQKIVRVANSSFGKYVRARSVALLVSVLKKKPFELLVVGAAGNDDSMARSYPAALNDGIAVAATNGTDAKAPYSNFGPWVDVAAPGGDKRPNGGDGGITSPVPGASNTDSKNGTSMAAPVVSGVAGLILAVDPTRSFTALRNSILDTADCRLYAPTVNNGINFNSYYPKVQGENARRPLLGSGIVDAAAAIENKARNDCAGAAVRRVNRNCGVVAYRDAAVAGSDLPLRAAAWILGLLPLLTAVGAQRALTRRAGGS